MPEFLQKELDKTLNDVLCVRGDVLVDRKP